MKKRIGAILLLTVMLCGLMAAAAAATYGTVVGGWLRLRANPSYQATVIASYKTGSIVTILSQSGGWARVMTADYRLGYMDQRYLYIEGSTPVTPKPVTPSVTWTTVNRKAWVTSANGKGVRLRNAPVVNKYNVMGLYPVGRTVTELKVSNNGWSYILIDGKYGYMMSQFLTTGYAPWPEPPTEKPTGKPTEKPTAKPTEEPYVTPEPETLKGVALNNMSPVVGDTLKVAVTPSNFKYSVVWYRATDKVLVSTGNSYKVTDADVGSAITVRVTGSDGTVAEVSTNPVKAMFSSSAKIDTAAASSTLDASLPQTGEWLDTGVTQSGSAQEDTWWEDLAGAGSGDSSGAATGSTEDLPWFVRQTLEEGEGTVAVQPVP